jgi:hypothetical protein
MSYIGAQPTTASFPFDQFSGNGSTTAFTLSYAPANTTSIIVSISGVVQNPNTYTVSGVTLTFSPAPPTGTNNIGVLYLGLPVQVGTLTPGSTFEFGLGSVSSPSITFIGDTNTGIYSPGADTIAFTEGGVESMRLNSSGNLGIGTTTPAAKLSVVGTGYSPNINLTDAATIAWDTSLGQVATFTFVSTNRAVGAPTNLVNGAFYALAVIQNAGSNTLTWNAVFKWTGGTAPTLSTAAGARDYFVFRSDGTNLYQQGQSLAVA